MKYESKSILGKTTIDVNPNGIDIEAKNKTTHYDFSDYQGTHVIKNYYNGIYTGKTRYISFHDESVKLGKRKMLNFSHKEKDDFIKIAADIDKTIFDISEKPDEVLRHFETPVTFEVPDDIKRNSIKRILLLTVLPVVLITIALIVSLFIDNVVGTMIKAFCLAGYVVELILVIPEISYIIKGMKNIPERLGIDAYAIKIDDDSFAREAIEYLKLTPSAYRKWERRLTIRDRDGEHIYSFGSSNNNLNKVNPRTMPDYDNLYESLRLWCHLNNVTFYSDLG
ncbi:MAG: hypothetical protein IJ757_02415 [Clostridiales bacterium]|nr:hypothetical protein [Clostridiales bacterium]